MIKINYCWFLQKINWMKFILFFVSMGFIFSFTSGKAWRGTNEWIRINQLGYTPQGIKVAVWCSKDESSLNSFDLIDSVTGKIVFTQNVSKSFGAYGPFTNTYRLNFSFFTTAGVYYLKAGNAVSPVFKINADVYKGTQVHFTWVPLYSIKLIRFMQIN